MAGCLVFLSRQTRAKKFMCQEDSLKLMLDIALQPISNTAQVSVLTVSRLLGVHEWVYVSSWVVDRPVLFNP